MPNETSKPTTDQAYIDARFPECDPFLEPTGHDVLLQVMLAPAKSQGGIIMTEARVTTEQEGVTIVKVIALGPAAFKTYAGDQAISGGARFAEGDIMRLNAWTQGDHFHIKVDGRTVPFRQVEERHVRGKITNLKGFLEGWAPTPDA